MSSRLRYFHLIVKVIKTVSVLLSEKVLNKHKVYIYNTFGFKRWIFLKVPIELYIDFIPESPKRKKRILLLMEPNVISNLKNAILLTDQNKFDLILTYDSEVLYKVKNSKLFLHGTTWIKDFPFTDKVFGVSSLIGGKTITSQHILRHRLFELLDLKLSVKLFFFNSVNYPYPSQDFRLLNMKSKHNKNELFSWQYHIAIENVSSENYFSEKLMDCFQTKTIPIYMGCTNIGDFFNVEGMFIVKSFEEIVTVLESLTEETYSQKIKAVEYNYIKSNEYVNFGERLELELDIFSKSAVLIDG